MRGHFRKRQKKCAFLFSGSVFVLASIFALFSVDLEIFLHFFIIPGGKDIPQSDIGAIVALSNEDLSHRAIATSIAGLKKIARKVWRQVSAEYLEKLYESLLRRMEAVIAAGGGHTKY